jgi:MinD superfamily P-loop ATPase
MFWEKKYRGVAFVNSEKCEECGKCVKVCRHQALKMVTIENEKRAIANTNRCTGCGKCIAICPQKAIEIIF